jgi:hypothetical protein
MRKVELTMEENYQYEKVKRFTEENGNFKRLCKDLECSLRTARRKVKGYREEGKAFFHHGNHDHKPSTTIGQATRDEIIRVYNRDYYDANFTHFHELLERYHPEIPKVSISTLRNIFKEVDILSPKAWKSTKKALRKKDKQKEVVQEGEILLAPPSISMTPHPRRERSKYRGELIFMDASIHIWFAGITAVLHAAIDDADGTVVGAFFDHQETRHGYYHTTAQILRNHGIPLAFQTDGRTVFDYKRKGRSSLEEDTPTQFGYACKSLGITLHRATCAQAQGKIERLFQTLQSRLIVELRLQSVTTIEQANQFLKSYIPIYNEKFATPVQSIKSTFENPPSEEEINLTLAVLSTRTVDMGHCISYKNQYYRFLDKRADLVPLRHKQKVTVIKALDGGLFASANDYVFSLQAVPRNKIYSFALDAKEPLEKRREVYIPPLMHPWRKGRFEAFATDYRKKLYSFEELSYTTENFLWD